MPIKNMTPEQIAEATRAQVTAGVKSTTKAAKLEGETQSEANARLTAAYKELTAKPILSQEQIEGGMKVQYVRTGSGGVGEYTAIKPFGYIGPTKITEFTPGVIPEGAKYTTGSAVGLDTGGRTVDEYTKVLVGKLAAGVPLTAKEREWLDTKGSKTLNPNVTTVAPTPTPTPTPTPNPTNTGLKTVNGILYNNGVPFNGKAPDGKVYTNGIANDDEDNTVVNNATKPSESATLISTETDAYGNVVGVYSDSTTKVLIPSGNKYKSTVDEDAYAVLMSTMKDYGLEELVPDIQKFMEAGIGENQAGIEIRKTEAYQNRFKGNAMRLATGKNALGEDAYLALEDSYNQTLRAYGLQNYFGIDRKVAQAKMADIIGNDISSDEFVDRIDTVVTRVNNADPKIKQTLNRFYNITDDDLVKYFLNPKENLPMLEEKVTSAEIGAAALAQAGLTTDVASATALAKMGITKAVAQKGYGEIAEALPGATKLSQIYGEEGINYTQKTAEEEVFGQLESAKRKRLKLAEKEVGTFSGSSGLSRGALGNGKSSAF
jgi:hypothetical protein